MTEWRWRGTPDSCPSPSSGRRVAGTFAFPALLTSQKLLHEAPADCSARQKLQSSASKRALIGQKKSFIMQRLACTVNACPVLRRSDPVSDNRAELPGELSGKQQKSGRRKRTAPFSMSACHRTAESPAADRTDTREHQLVWQQQQALLSAKMYQQEAPCR